MRRPRDRRRQQPPALGREESRGVVERVLDWAGSLVIVSFVVVALPLSLYVGGLASDAQANSASDVNQFSALVVLGLPLLCLLIVALLSFGRKLFAGNFLCFVVGFSHFLSGVFLVFIGSNIIFFGGRVEFAVVAFLFAGAVMLYTRWLIDDLIRLTQEPEEES